MCVCGRPAAFAMPQPQPGYHANAFSSFGNVFQKLSSHEIDRIMWIRVVRKIQKPVINIWFGRQNARATALNCTRPQPVTQQRKHFHLTLHHEVTITNSFGGHNHRVWQNPILLVCFCFVFFRVCALQPSQLVQEWHPQSKQFIHIKPKSIAMSWTTSGRIKWLISRLINIRIESGRGGSEEEATPTGGGEGRVSTPICLCKPDCLFTAFYI